MGMNLELHPQPIPVKFVRACKFPPRYLNGFSMTEIRPKYDKISLCLCVRPNTAADFRGWGGMMLNASIQCSKIRLRPPPRSLADFKVGGRSEERRREGKR